jgi:post-segregation antitoxin (ccd killing protein)
MAKANTTVCLDVGLVAKLKERGFNISELCNTALHNALAEERIAKDKADITEEEFKKEVAYQDWYDSLNRIDATGLNGLRGEFSKKATTQGLLKAHPDADPVAVAKYLKKKFAL